MNADHTTDLTPLPTDTVIDAEPSTLEPTGSIADHAKQYGPQAKKPEAEPPEKEAKPPAEPLAPIRPVDRQNREEGKFTAGTKRLKAKDAVDRINQLTGRAKTAEEKLAVTAAELAHLRAARAPQAEIRHAEHRVERAEARTAAAAGFPEPEPQENDAKFTGDYGTYLRAAAAWDGRKAYWEAQQAERQAQAQRHVEEAQQQTLRSWSGRVSAAKAKYQDFEAVAFGPTRIPAGSTPDAWIMEHKAGADVLYFLQSHPQELDSLLGMPVLEQVEYLTLLSQRLLSPQDAQAGSTGSAAAPAQAIVLPPKPPNPVRTSGAQRASDSPPPTDGSLSIAEHAKQFGTMLRRR